MIREHVKRNHGLPSFHCKRCCESFTKESDLEDHQRAATACLVKQRVETPRDFADGFDKDQENQINKRSTRNTPDHEKWTDLYCILFQVERDAAPSPCEYWWNMMASP